MSIMIYNSMSRSKEEFRPQQPGKASIYVCGPTVYDYIHIGNARPAIFFDVVRRYLEYAGYEVDYVVNFTDVDDKLIRRAAEVGKTVPEVAAQFIEAFHEDTAALGVRTASMNPRVTEHLPEIIAFISELVAGGHAYPSEGDVYFRTSSFKDYGKLSHQNIEELQFGIRIEVDDRKENAGDFVLWKGAKPGEISWDSPWGPGRPGWHIECSAMARKYLGDTIDIHGGGTDLQFPHHECEVAQSESLTGKPLANYWMHNGYINIDNEKMSKSLGNGVTVHELVKGVKPEAIRYFMLAAHYRGPLNFSEEAIAQAENSVERINNFAGNLKHRLAAMDNASPLEDGQHEALREKIAGIEQLFQAKMNDDFNTPDAITALFELVAAGNQYMQGDLANAKGLKLLQDALERMDDVLGLLYAGGGDELLDEDIDRLIAERTEARKAKNWARADEIRDLLAELDIVLEDTPQGIRWRRK
ncbi:cysteine--tRNA ligase [Paenibacillus chungangensis]|uniref:Cysteine--tRNA ligase n=1 Tax=Paenibacillus chungangensis TaxID=696535 RepID=A0ABW3HWS0_9BACL